MHAVKDLDTWKFNLDARKKKGVSLQGSRKRSSLLWKHRNLRERVTSYSIPWKLLFQLNDFMGGLIGGDWLLVPLLSSGCETKTTLNTAPNVNGSGHLYESSQGALGDSCRHYPSELATRAAGIFSLRHTRKFVQASNKYWSLKLIDLCIETIFTQAPTKESENTVNCDDDD